MPRRVYIVEDDYALEHLHRHLDPICNTKWILLATVLLLAILAAVAVPVTVSLIHSKAQRNRPDSDAATTALNLDTITTTIATTVPVPDVTAATAVIPDSDATLITTGVPDSEATATSALSVPEETTTTVFDQKEMVVLAICTAQQKGKHSEREPSRSSYRERVLEVIARLLKKNQNLRTKYVIEQFGSDVSFSEPLPESAVLAELRTAFDQAQAADDANVTKAIESFGEFSRSLYIPYILFIPDSSAYRDRKTYKNDMRTARNSLKRITKGSFEAPRIVIEDPPFFRDLSDTIHIFPSNTKIEELVEAISKILAKLSISDHLMPTTTTASLNEETTTSVSSPSFDTADAGLQDDVVPFTTAKDERIGISEAILASTVESENTAEQSSVIFYTGNVFPDITSGSLATDNFTSLATTDQKVANVSETIPLSITSTLPLTILTQTQQQSRSEQFPELSTEQSPAQTTAEQYPEESETEVTSEDTRTEQVPKKAETEQLLEARTEQSPEEATMEQNRTEQTPEETRIEESPMSEQSTQVIRTEQIPEEIRTLQTPEGSITEQTPNEIRTEQTPEETMMEKILAETGTQQASEETGTEQSLEVTRTEQTPEETRMLQTFDEIRTGQPPKKTTTELALEETGTQQTSKESGTEQSPNEQFPEVTRAEQNAEEAGTLQTSDEIRTGQTPDETTTEQTLAETRTERTLETRTEESSNETRTEQAPQVIRTEQIPEETRTLQTPEGSITKQTPNETRTERTPEETKTEKTLEETGTRRTPEETGTEQSSNEQSLEVTRTEQTPEKTRMLQTFDEIRTGQTPKKTTTELALEDTKTQQTSDETITEQPPNERRTEQSPKVTRTGKIPDETRTMQTTEETITEQTSNETRTEQTPEESMTEKTLEETGTQQTSEETGTEQSTNEIRTEQSSEVTRIEQTPEETRTLHTAEETMTEQTSEETTVEQSPEGTRTEPLEELRTGDSLEMIVSEQTTEEIRTEHSTEDTHTEFPEVTWTEQSPEESKTEQFPENPRTKESPEEIRTEQPLIPTEPSSSTKTPSAIEEEATFPFTFVVPVIQNPSPGYDIMIWPSQTIGDHYTPPVVLSARMPTVERTTLDRSNTEVQFPKLSTSFMEGSYSADTVYTTLKIPYSLQTKEPEAVSSDRYPPVSTAEPTFSELTSEEVPQTFASASSNIEQQPSIATKQQHMEVTGMNEESGIIYPETTTVGWGRSTKIITLPSTALEQFSTEYRNPELETDLTTSGMPFSVSSPLFPEATNRLNSVTNKFPLGPEEDHTETKMKQTLVSRIISTDEAKPLSTTIKEFEPAEMTTEILEITSMEPSASSTVYEAESPPPVDIRSTEESTTEQSATESPSATKSSTNALELSESPPFTGLGLTTIKETSMHQTIPEAIFTTAHPESTTSNRQNTPGSRIIDFPNTEISDSEYLDTDTPVELKATTMTPYTPPSAFITDDHPTFSEELGPTDELHSSVMPFQTLDQSEIEGPGSDLSTVVTAAPPTSGRDNSFQTVKIREQISSKEFGSTQSNTATIALSAVTAAPPEVTTNNPYSSLAQIVSGRAVTLFPQEPIDTVLSHASADQPVLQESSTVATVPPELSTNRPEIDAWNRKTTTKVTETLASLIIASENQLWPSIISRTPESTNTGISKSTISNVISTDFENTEHPTAENDDDATANAVTNGSQTIALSRVVPISESELFISPSIVPTRSTSETLGTTVSTVWASAALLRTQEIVKSTEKLPNSNEVIFSTISASNDVEETFKSSTVVPSTNYEEILSSTPTVIPSSYGTSALAEESTVAGDYLGTTASVNDASDRFYSTKMRKITERSTHPETTELPEEPVTGFTQVISTSIGITEDDAYINDFAIYQAAKPSPAIPTRPPTERRHTKCKPTPDAVTEAPCKTSTTPENKEIQPSTRTLAKTKHIKPTSVTLTKTEAPCSSHTTLAGTTCIYPSQMPQSTEKVVADSTDSDGRFPFSDISKAGLSNSDEGFSPLASLELPFPRRAARSISNFYNDAPLQGVRGKRSQVNIFDAVLPRPLRLPESRSQLVVPAA